MKREKVAAGFKKSYPATNSFVSTGCTYNIMTKQCQMPNALAHSIGGLLGAPEYEVKRTLCGLATLHIQ